MANSIGDRRVLRAGQRFAMLPGADGAGWQPICLAPRNGTVIEIRNSYGVAPWYGLFRWTTDGFSSSPGGLVRATLARAEWVRVDGEHPGSMVTDGPHLTWRPYTGDISGYADPTGGLQDDMAYWRGAVAAKHGLPLDHFEYRLQGKSGDGAAAGVVVGPGESVTVAVPPVPRPMQVVRPTGRNTPPPLVAADAKAPAWFIVLLWVVVAAAVGAMIYFAG